jgi:hypothetical protein
MRYKLRKIVNERKTNKQENWLAERTNGEFGLNSAYRVKIKRKNKNGFLLGREDGRKCLRIFLFFRKHFGIIGVKLAGDGGVQLQFCFFNWLYFWSDQ